MARPRFRVRSLMLAVAALAVGFGGLAWLGRAELLPLLVPYLMVPAAGAVVAAVVLAFDRGLAHLDSRAVARPASSPAPARPEPIFPVRPVPALPVALASGLSTR